MDNNFMKVQFTQFNQPQKKKVNGMAVASLILGIIGLLSSCILVGIVPSVIGLILGIVSMKQEVKSKGLSIGGIVCSGLGIAIFVFMIVIAVTSPAETDTSDNDKEVVEQVEESTTKETEKTTKKNTKKETTTKSTTKATTTVNKAEKEKADADKFKSECVEMIYKDVARNPEKYIGQKFKITVKISTVETSGWFSDYDYAYKCYTNDEYDWWMGDFLYLLDSRNKDNSQYIKILEDDIVTVYGIFDGMIETTNNLTGIDGEDVSLDIKYVELISQ